MAVYVDDAFIQATVPNGARMVTGRWCHMTADTDEELHVMADRIGLRRAWFQPHARRPEANHYDVTESRRRAAVAAGAVEETTREGSVRRRAAGDRRHEVWSCRNCGPHPRNTARWCDVGCGRDHGGMTRMPTPAEEITMPVTEDTLAAARWYPVEAHLGRVTDFIIMAGDPINGDFVGCYGDMGTAHYVSRLHNLRLPHRALGGPLAEADAMFQSEIDFVVSGLWDGGIDWYLGNGPSVGAQVDAAMANGSHGNAETVEQALVDMRNAARAAYPESTFAKLYCYDTELVDDQRGVDELTALLSEKHAGSDVTVAYSPQVDAYEPAWTVTVEETDVCVGGYSLSEALRQALG